MKQGLIILAVYVTLGLIINVSLAWWFAIEDGRNIGPQTWSARRDQRHWPSSPPRDWPEATRSMELAFAGRRQVIAYRVPQDLAPDIPGPVIVTYSMTVRQYGWPLPSMESRWLFMPAAGTRPEGAEPVPAVTLQQGVLVPPLWLQVKVPKLVFIPVRPMFGGFVADTAAYAVALWLPIGIPVAIRRVIRPMRGRCPRCGYDLRGAQHERCPECGRPVRRRAARNWSGPSSLTAVANRPSDPAPALVSQPECAAESPARRRSAPPPGRSSPG